MRTNRRKDKKMSEEQGCRPVRIHVAITGGPISLNARQVLKSLGDENSHFCVDDPAVADLIIFSDKKKIGDFATEKQYALLPIPGHGSELFKLPENCAVINWHYLSGVSDIINGIRQKMSIPEVSASS